MIDAVADPPAPSIGRLVATGAIITGAAEATKLVLTTLTTIAAARLISPGDYGVVAMATPVISLIMILQDFGISGATIQAETISHDENTALFWINMAAGVAGAMVLLAVSPLVVLFYGDARAGYFTAASAAVVIATAGSLQHFALLQRRLQFGWLIVVDLARSVVASSVTIGVALVFASYWALWSGLFAGAIVGAVLAWRFCRWRPSGRPRLATAREKAGFGGNITGSNLLNLLVRNADEVIVAKAFGAHQLGLYDRSYRLMMMPIQSINGPLGRVMLPVLSRLRGDPRAYRRTYLDAGRTILLLTIPGMMVAATTSPMLVPFLLGPQWTGSVPIFFWLSLVGLVQPLANTTGWLYVSSGRVRAQLWWSAFSAIVTVAGFLIGVRWGATGVAASLFVTSVARLPLLYWLSVRGTPVRSLDLYRVTLSCAIGAVPAVPLIHILMGRLAILPLLAVALPLAYALTLAASLVDPAMRALMMRGVTFLTVLLRRGRPA